MEKKEQDLTGLLCLWYTVSNSETTDSFVEGVGMDKSKLIEKLIEIAQLGIKSSIASFECGRTLSNKWTSERRRADTAFFNAIDELKEEVLRS